MMPLPDSSGTTAAPAPPAAALTSPTTSLTDWINGLLAATLIALCMLDAGNYVGGVLLDTTTKVVYYPMLAMAGLILLTTSRLALGRLRPAILLFAGVYCALNLLHALFYIVDAAGESREIAITRIQYMLLALAIVTVATVLPRIVLARVFAVCAVLVSGSILFDFLFPFTLYEITTKGLTPGRVGGFYIDPNKAGEAAVLTALLAMPALTRRSAAAIMVLAGAAVVVTFSRSGMVAWLLTACLFVLVGKITRAQVLVVVLAGAVLALSGTAVQWLVLNADLPSVNAADVLNRLEFLGTGDLRDDSAQERAAVRAAGFEVFLAHPWAGAGAGATHLWEYSVAPHNQLVQMAAEYGLTGVAGWLSLVALVLTGNY
ncbi:MAG: O-antigen ligase family protein, partial [Lautropia sp.]